MRKLILVVLFMILTMSMLFGEGLSKNARYIKEFYPNGYEKIKAIAVNEWGSDHSMVLFRINNLSDSLTEVIQLLSKKDGDLGIFTRAVANWSTRGTVAKNDKIIASWTHQGEFSSIYGIDADWSMILFEYEMQVSAASAY